MQVVAPIVKQNSISCMITEYEVDDDYIDLVIAHIVGREPVEGFVSNQVCKEFVIIADGSGVLNCNGVETELYSGMAILISPGERFFWAGDIELYIQCSPPWHVSQYVHHDRLKT